MQEGARVVPEAVHFGLVSITGLHLALAVERTRLFFFLFFSIPCSAGFMPALLNSLRVPHAGFSRGLSWFLP